jgi:peptide/nickel transport system substrate-binding protein
VFDLNLASLWNIDNDGNYVMDLAEELPTLENGGVSEDGLAITIKLKPDVTWSDGTPLTAGDAVFTYDMIMDEGNSSYSRYPWDTYVESLTAVDDHTLQINLTAPYADWSTSLFVGISRIIPRHVLEPVFQAEGTLDNAEWNRLPTVGSGPFILTAFEPASHIALAANDRYWRGRPHLDEIYMRLLEDRAAQLAALASGESDIGSYITGAELSTINGMGNVDITSSINGYQVVTFLMWTPIPPIRP